MSTPLRIRFRACAAAAVVAFLMPVAGAARNYHVSPSGLDAASGTPGAPLRSIQTAAGLARAGDTIYVHAGVYREAITMAHSGEPGRPIVLRNVPGDHPIVQPGDAPGLQPPGHGVLLQAAAGYRHEIGWIVIEGLEVRWGWDGVKIYNAHDVVIRGCDLHHNYNQGILGNGNRVSIEGNVIAHNGTKADDDYDGLAHGIYGTGTAFTITNNLIHSNRAYGVQVAAYPLNEDMAGLEYSGARNWVIANNTIAFSQNRGGVVLWQAGVFDAVVQNNIFYRNAGPPVDVLGQKGKGHVLRNNLFHPPTTLYERLGGGEFQQADNRSLDPLFLDPEAHDFRLRPGSPAIDGGASEAAPAHDFAGTPRPQGAAVDIGAFEFDAGATTAVDEQHRDGGRAPTVTLRNVPNPFNSGTKILVNLPRAGVARISIYDMAGQRVRDLWQGPLAAGMHAFDWDAADASGAGVASGVYLARLSVDGSVRVLPLTLIR